MFYNKVLNECLEVIELLKSFKDVKRKCFGMKVETGWKQSIKDFCSKMRAIDDMSFFLKLHVPQFLDRQHQKPGYEDVGLGFYNKQSFECVHQDFPKLWENDKRDPDSEGYDNQ